jgi:hypothetical protein
VARAAGVAIEVSKVIPAEAGSTVDVAIEQLSTRDPAR